MMSSLLLEMGYKSLDRLAMSATRRTERTPDPLAAYPRLKMLVNEAEKSGFLASERRKLMVRRLSA